MKQDKNKTTPVMKEEIHDTPLDYRNILEDRKVVG
jgi:hypothetical protein